MYFTISDLLTPSSLRISFCRPQTCTKLKIYGDAGHLQKRVLESEMIFDRIKQKKQIFKSSLKDPFFKIGIFLTFICNYQFLALLSVFDHLCVTFIFILYSLTQKKARFFFKTSLSVFLSSCLSNKIFLDLLRDAF